MPRIRPCLWFDDQAEEPAQFYTSVFKNSPIVDVARYGAAGPRPAGEVMLVTFELGGQQFLALNGGPEFTFNEAIWLEVSCADQAEVDEYWARLTEGGEESMCGWLKDRYGVSWQIVPQQLEELIGGPDAEGGQRAMAAMLSMRKIDVAELQRAYDGA